MAKRRTGIVAGLGRRRLSLEVQQTIPVGSEPADSGAALERYQDRVSPDNAVDVAAFNAAASGGVYDSRVSGEYILVGDPPVPIFVTETSLTTQQTMSMCEIATNTSSGTSLDVGESKVVGELFGASLVITGMTPTVWQTELGDVASWVYDGGPGVQNPTGHWYSQERSGIHKLGINMSIESSTQNVDLVFRWQRFVASTWQTIASTPEGEINVNTSPKGYGHVLSGVSAPISADQLQRLLVERLGGGPSTFLTFKSINIIPEIVQFD